jgi:DNA polymerase-3 subunit beta
MKTNSKKLLAAVKKLTGVINNPSIPILANVRIEVRDNKATLTGTNLSQSAKVYVDVEGDGIDTTINFKRISAILGQLPNDDLLMVVKDDSATIKCGKSKFKLSCIDSSGWPKDEFEGEPITFDIDLDLFRNHISQVFYSVSRDESRPVLSGVMIELDSGNFRAVATDGKRLSVSSINGVHQDNINAKIICPVGILLDICKNSSDSIYIKIYDSKMCVKSGDYEVVTKLIEGNYPNYKQIIPKDFSDSVTIDRLSLLESIQRVSLILDESQNAIQLIFKDNELTLSAQTKDSANESFCVDFDGNAEFNFNPTLLVDMLKNVQSNEVVLNYNDSTSPTLISCDNLRYIVMPMRG